ncbi:hypothetical protein [Nocardia brasiliensis]|uniref:hypothetical protein n=1 Tax=Nocardia brasiliensis TaxID=37326 RepID=UPI0024553A15|nr:hypothetical protein [Nocardia brasiliensis]
MKLVVVAGLMTVAMIAGCTNHRDGESGESAAVDTSTAPIATRWESYRGVWVPFGDAGPAEAKGVAPTGYRRTPQGAVLAAMQAQPRLALAPDDVWAQIAALLIAPGPGRDAYATARVLASVTGEADPARTAQFAGFRIQSWTRDAVTVSLATRMPDGKLSAQPTKLVWRGTDWKVELSVPTPVHGSGEDRVPTDPVELQSLADYTPFAK